ncbi:DUF4838 domain-containing protein [Chitinophaga filiformis]|uniref:DUF4838 domain-containing protein n=1 Tax=Chitinophaga filiformis TaxID=104663 RepID=A0ABY4IA63_CHIFI|nr:DUF4838 domain-containing protein [Chitinophaga filiformis]UPK72762.1 DUF4838 domain-containing protein [Chitinophaga filiformis]
MKKAFLLLAVLSGAFISCAQGIVLVKNNVAVSGIVVAKNASDQVQTAAKTLQLYLQKSTGATLPIRNTGQGTSNLYVGKGAYAGIGNVNLDEDGFLLQSVGGNNFVILGGSDWGTEFGVYDFLERFVGVRWLMPTDVGTVIPKLNTLQIPTVKIVENPVFLSRAISPIWIDKNTTPMNQWGRFNRLRGRVDASHNLKNLFPPEKFSRSHPEFYPMVKGQKVLPQTNADQSWQPDFTAPGISDAASKEIINWFGQHKDATNFSLGINDSGNFNESASIRSRGQKNTLGFLSYSDQYYAWANDVVSKVRKIYPGKKYPVLAYTFVVDPPANSKVDKDIIPFIAYERARWGAKALKQQDQDLTERWGQAAESLGWYDYIYGLTYLLPRVWFHAMKDYLVWGSTHKVKYYYAELYPNWGEGPKAWVLSKLLWNPNQDVDALLDDWYRNAAGKQGGPKLKAFYAIWEKFWTQDVFANGGNSDTKSRILFYDPSYLQLVPDDYLTQSDKLLGDALKLAETDQQKQLVTRLTQMWTIYRLSAVAYKKYKQGNGNSPEGRQRLQLLQSLKTDLLYSLPANSILSRASVTGNDW